MLVFFSSAQAARPQVSAALPTQQRGDNDWVPPLVLETATRQLPELQPALPADFHAAIRRLPLRNDLSDEFEGAVRNFEAWVRLLLLDALQRLGFFRNSGEVSACKPLKLLQAQGCADVMPFALPHVLGLCASSWGYWSRVPVPVLRKMLQAHVGGRSVCTCAGCHAQQSADDSQCKAQPAAAGAAGHTRGCRLHHQQG